MKLIMNLYQVFKKFQKVYFFLCLHDPGIRKPQCRDFGIGKFVQIPGLRDRDCPGIHPYVQLSILSRCHQDWDSRSAHFGNEFFVCLIQKRGFVGHPQISTNGFCDAFELDITTLVLSSTIHIHGQNLRGV